MNWQAVISIYQFEMARFFRTLAQSFISPVISTSLYFVVFGTAIGSRFAGVDPAMLKEGALAGLGSTVLGLAIAGALALPVAYLLS